MSNCLIFAFSKWVRFGGYVIARKSNHGWWPHFMWVQSLGDLEIEEYMPERELIICNTFQVPPFLFKGVIRRGPDRMKSRVENKKPN